MLHGLSPNVHCCFWWCSCSSTALYASCSLWHPQKYITYTSDCYMYDTSSPNNPHVHYCFLKHPPQITYTSYYYVYCKICCPPLMSSGNVLPLDQFTNSINVYNRIDKWHLSSNCHMRLENMICFPNPVQQYLAPLMRRGSALCAVRVVCGHIDVRRKHMVTLRES